MIIFIIIIFLKKLDQVFSKHIKSNKCSIEQNSPKKKQILNLCQTVRRNQLLTHTHGILWIAHICDPYIKHL